MQRVTGILLLAAFLAHYVATHVSTAHYVEYDKIAMRVASPTWKFINIFFLTIVLLHALYGVWNVLLDVLARRPTLRLVLLSLLATVGLALYIVGLVTVVPFTADGLPAAPEASPGAW